MLTLTRAQAQEANMVRASEVQGRVPVRFVRDVESCGCIIFREGQVGHAVPGTNYGDKRRRSPFVCDYGLEYGTRGENPFPVGDLWAIKPADLELVDKEAHN